MTRIIALVTITGALACANGIPQSAVPARSVLLVYATGPEPADTAAVKRTGATDLLVIPLARALIVRSTDPADSLRKLPHVSWVSDTPSLDDPRSVYITVNSPPTASDLASIRSISGHSVSFTPPSSVAATVMNVRDINKLSAISIVSGANIGTDDVTTQGGVREP